jgi:hypothetical protein
MDISMSGQSTLAKKLTNGFLKKHFGKQYASTWQRKRHIAHL